MRKIVLFGFIIILNLTGFAQTINSVEKDMLQKKPKNIIFFIGDGMGFNHVLATSYYQFGEDGKQVYQGNEWVKLSQSTYPAVLKNNSDPKVYAAGYNPQKAWSDSEYAKKDYTDSGAGGTALSTGRKTYNGSIGMGVFGDTLYNVAESAKAIGKAIGVVSSVPLSHATPASFIAHNEYRNNYAQIAQYMIFSSKTDVIMAPGNPDYDDNAMPSKGDSQSVGGIEVWNWLKAGGAQTELVLDGKKLKVKDIDGDGNPDPWVLVQDSIEFVKLMNGPTPKRVIGVPKVYSTLQQGRNVIEGSVMPFETPFNREVPSLEQMSMAAINVLSKNESGFFLMIEGGAIDWASHSNQSDRLIEEQIAFNKAIESAVQWVEKNSSWDETLIIITADHECGYLTGPGTDDDLFKPVENKGKGQLPGMQFNYGNHTNVLVPLYARGPGSHLYEILAGQLDPVRGRYIQNTDIPNMIFMLWGKEVRW